MKVISIATSCYNEAKNIPEFYERCRAVLSKFPQYDYEFVVADNFSTDGTREILREIASKDQKFRVILNANNFGHIRSPYNAILNTRGDAVVTLCSDLQEPPEVIEAFLHAWESGAKVVVGIRNGTHSHVLMEQVRKFYYWLLENSVSGSKPISRFTGFGLYDRAFVEALKQFHEPYPYFRGLVSEIGFSRVEVPFVQDRRKHGRTKNNFLTLYDMAMTGFVNHTKLPLRLATLTGICVGFFSFLISIYYFVMKLLYWDTFSLGMAPLMIGMFFLSAVQLFFIGVIGEYLGAIWTQVKNRPLVIEEERINF